MSSNMISSSLYTLPTELIYRIFDVLDTKTILFSCGHVCQRFYSLAHTYHRYKLNFQLISKPSFHSICSVIHPENINSLILSNDHQTPEQIKTFFILFPLEQFIHLRLLKLIQIEENLFNELFQFIHYLSSLQHLSITFRTKSCQILLPSIISQSNLRYFHLGSSLNKFDEFFWPNECFLQTLILSQSIHFKQFSHILSQSIYLKKFILSDCIIQDTIDVDSITSYPQLISLTFEDSELNINECKLILSLLPSLEYLQIVGGTNLSDGLFWEQFIRTKLIQLNQFEFAFCGNTEYVFENSNDVERLIQSFRTPFWLEIKHWFVVCYYFITSTNYSLYSLPICKSNVRFYPQKDKISCSTYRELNTDITMMDSVHEMQLNLTNLMTHKDENEQNISSKNPFFRNINKLFLCIDDDWPVNSIDYLSSFIHLSSICELSISIDFDSKSLSNKLTNINHLLQQTDHLHTLVIDSTTIDGENLYLLIPKHVKHLQVTVQSMEEIKLIIQRLRHLSSITFELIQIGSTEVSKWLMEISNKSTYRYEHKLFSIWFDKLDN